MNEANSFKMKQMHLSGMHATYQGLCESGELSSLDHEQLLSTLLEAEWMERLNKKVARNIKVAAFQYRASIEEVIYAPERNLNRNQIEELAEGTYIKSNENLLITGATGVGKSYVATALGYQACINEYKVGYFPANKLFTKLRIAKLENTYLKELTKLQRFHLLILDDFGLQMMEKHDRITLLEIIEDRNGKGALIVTSQLPVSKWFDVIGEKTLADAILDRLVHQSHRIELTGESMRKKIKKTN